MTTSAFVSGHTYQNHTPQEKQRKRQAPPVHQFSAIVHTIRAQETSADEEQPSANERSNNCQRHFISTAAV